MCVYVRACVRACARARMCVCVCVGRECLLECFDAKIVYVHKMSPHLPPPTSRFDMGRRPSSLKRSFSLSLSLSGGGGGGGGVSSNSQRINTHAESLSCDFAN